MAAILAMAAVALSTAFTVMPIIGKGKSPPSSTACWPMPFLKAHDDAIQKRVVPTNGNGVRNPGRRRAICVCEGEYGDAITRGRFYDILNRTKCESEIVDDNGRTDWYGAHCFDYGKDSVAVLTNITIEKFRSDDHVTAWLVLSDGTERSCDLCTPKHLFGHKRIPGKGIPFHCGLEHTIVVEELSEDVIKEVLHYVDSQGDLEANSYPWGYVDDYSHATEAVNVTGTGKKALCVREGYKDAITRGRFYQVFETRNDMYGRREMRIVDDDGCQKWFGTFYLDMEKESVPKLTKYKIQGGIQHPDEFLEVDLDLSDGTQRWCWIGTPQSFYHASGDDIPGTNVTFHHHLKNSVIIRSDGIREADVEKVLHYIDVQGELNQCSAKVDDEEDDGHGGDGN